jgi:dTDP-glucose 4,6-dehydratase
MKKALITGGAGFIGSAVVRRLILEGYYVVIIDNLFRGSMENINDLPKDKFKFYNLDLEKFNSIDTLSEVLVDIQPELIGHYAAINGTEYFYDMPERVAVVNSIGTYCILEALKHAKSVLVNFRPVFLFASTSENYGEPLDYPSKENSITYVRISEKRDSYAAAKIMSEHYVKLYAESFSFDYLILRIFNVYGPAMIGTRYGQVIPEFINRLKDGEYPLRIIGNGMHTRSFIYIDDHVELTIRLLNKGQFNDVINLGNPEEVTIKDLGYRIMTLLGFEPAFEYLDARPGDHLRRKPDIRKLLELVGPYDFISLNDGLRAFLNLRSL